MVSSYYSQAKVKRILEIATADTSDDTFLDEIGAAADQKMDSILKIHDERIPLASGNVLNDAITAVNYYVSYLYKTKRGDHETAKVFKEIFADLLEGIIKESEITGQPYIVERFNSRFQTGIDDVFALWG